MTLLEKLYNGHLYPGEKIACRTPEYQVLCSKINEEREYLMSRLSPEDAKRFSEFESHIEESSSMYAYENFAYGFRLAATFACELMADKNNSKE